MSGTTAAATPVLTPGYVLVPNYHVYNDEGLLLFVTGDKDRAWEGRPRPAGRYVSTAWIPGNFLAEGRLTVAAALSTLDPVIVHFFERDVVGFHVVDSMEGDSARGAYAGHVPGVIRPLLNWTTNYESASP